MYAYNIIYNQKLTKQEILNLSIYFEIHVLKSPIGVQDFYPPLFGGGVNISFLQRTVSNIKNKKKIIREINKHAVFVKVGKPRSANKILKRQQDLKSKKKIWLEQLYDLNIEINNYFVNSRINIFKIGKFLRKSWLLKKSFSKKVSNSRIDKLISFLEKNGSFGEKLLGAGGSGYILFLTSIQNKKKLLSIGKIFNYQIENIILNDEKINIEK